MVNLLKIQFKKENIKILVLVSFVLVLANAFLNGMSIVTYESSEAVKEMVKSQMGNINYIEYMLRQLPQNSFQFLFIFGVVLVSGIIIDEYRGSTVKNLFTIPVKREKIITSKIIYSVLLTGIITAVFLILSLCLYVLMCNVLGVTGIDYMAIIGDMTGELTKIILDCTLLIFLPIALALVLNKGKVFSIAFSVGITIACQMISGLISMVWPSLDFLQIGYIITTVGIGIAIILMGIFMKKCLYRDIL